MSEVPGTSTELLFANWEPESPEQFLEAECQRLSFEPTGLRTPQDSGTRETLAQALIPESRPAFTDVSAADGLR